MTKKIKEDFSHLAHFAADPDVHATVAATIGGYASLAAMDRVQKHKEKRAAHKAGKRMIAGMTGKSPKPIHKSIMDRLHGIRKKVENSVREDVEQIDELSKKTLKSYMSKVDKEDRSSQSKHKQKKRLVGKHKAGLRTLKSIPYDYSKKRGGVVEDFDPNEVYMTEGEFMELLDYLVETYEEDDVVELLHEWAGASKTMKKAKVVGKKAVRKLKKYMNDTDG